MTNEQIIKKAIKKAIKNGWKLPGNKVISEVQVDDHGISLYCSKDKCFYNPGSENNIIFSHDFAKALGYKLKDLGAWCDEGKDPIKYLEKFLK